MSFRYFNPGFVDLLENKGLAVQNEGYDYSRTGVSYSQTSSNGILTTKQVNTKDLYVAFDFYNYSSNTGGFYSASTSIRYAHRLSIYNNLISLYYYNNNSNIQFSGIIISDEYIDPKEQVIKLPISSTQSDMAFDSETGIYTATATNQSLLSAVNVNSLVEEYGANSLVTGIIQVGNPAYNCRRFKFAYCFCKK